MKKSFTNKRLLLNIIIVGLLTFTMLFNVVYQGLFNPDIDETEPTSSHWQQSSLVPSIWQIKGIESPDFQIEKNQADEWTILLTDDLQIKALQNKKKHPDAQAVIEAWQTLLSQHQSPYEILPKGKTILVFIEEDSQPLVFRVIEVENKLDFFRMIDKQRFSFPIELKSRLIPL